MTTIGNAVGRWCDTEAFAYVAKCWDAIPAEKLPAMQGAWAVLKAVDMVSMLPLDEEFAARISEGEDALTEEEARRLTYWRAGHAHALLCAIWGFGDSFLSDRPVRDRDEAALGMCEKAEEWFHAKRLRDKGRHEPLRLAYSKAVKNYRVGMDLERIMKESAAACASATT